MKLYLFDLEPRRIGDFAPLLAHHQTSPASIFPRDLMLTRATQNGRISIRNMEWSRIQDGRRETGRFPDAATRRRSVLDDFGIELPPAVDG